MFWYHILKIFKPRFKRFFPMFPLKYFIDSDFILFFRVCLHIYVDLFFYFLTFLLLFKYSFLSFPPTPSHHPKPPHLSPLFPPALVIVHVSFIVVLPNPSPFSPIITSPLRSGHCQPVLNFSVFGYILLACSFC